jgi:hypothetical protein
MHACQYYTHLCVQLSARGIQILTIRYFNGFAFFGGTPYTWCIKKNATSEFPKKSLCNS